MAEYILALDQGTTSSRAVIFDRNGKVYSIAHQEFTQIYPQLAWVEHDPNEIWSSQKKVMLEVCEKIGGISKIHAIGITNQRETTIVWDRTNGKPIYNAIVWQDRRTASICDKLKEDGFTDIIQTKTGLIPDAYFSGTKLKWILDNVSGARAKANKGELAFGTVDSWLIWNLTGGKVHVTDVTNASRTMLFNIHSLQWDNELLSMLDIPLSLLPKVSDSSEIVGKTTISECKDIPIAGIAGDQQAALFGQQCIHAGMVKNTYGTGCFIVLNTGKEAVQSQNNLLTTIAWKIGDSINYALEGSIFVAGAAVQWLRDGLGIIQHSSEVEALASKVKDNGGVYFVPALTGLGAPYWDSDARGTICGLTRGTNASHIARATLEAIAYQTADVVRVMEKDSKLKIEELRVDGGASINNLLMQFQADVLQSKVLRPQTTETTALGAAFLAGLASGYWNSREEIEQIWKADKTFYPILENVEISMLVSNWNKAVSRSRL